MMIKTIIIEDEPRAAEGLKALIEAVCTSVNVCSLATSIEEAIEQTGLLKPDLLFVDVNLRDKQVFDLFDQLASPKPYIIFTTAFAEYAAKAFRFNAVDYLLKPIDPIQLLQSVEKVKTIMAEKELLEATKMHNENGSKTMILKTFDAIFPVKTANIVRCESDKSYTTFHLDNGRTIVVSKTMKEFETDLLEAGFIKVHQSHIVNPDFVFCFKKNDGGYLIMADQQEIPVSTRRKESLLAFLNRSC